MKTSLNNISLSKTLLAIGFMISLMSCTNQEEAVTFFIENSLQKELTIQNSGMTESQTSNINAEVTIDLRSAESFNTYIQRLRDLDLKSLEIKFEDFQGNIRDGEMYLGDVYLGRFDSSMQRVRISQPDTQKRIEDLLLEQTRADFTILGSCDTDYFLSVKVEMTLEGTFVH